MPSAAGDLHRETLARLLAVARHLSASSDLRDILRAIIDAMRDTLDADRATVFEYDQAKDELFTTVAHGVDRPHSVDTAPTPESEPAPREIRIPTTMGLAGQCARTRLIINTPDAYADARFNPAIDRRTGYRTRSILTIPLLDDEARLVGVAQVLNKRGRPFDAVDEEIAAALAAQAAVAMRRGRLIEDRLVKQKLERDLQLARTIQQSSFPAVLPAMRRFDIAAWSQPADQTGGDVYDVCARPGAVAADGAPSKVVLVMADATGHGVGPAISVTQLRSMFRMAVRLGADLRDIATHANEQLCVDLPGGRFITAWLGELNDADGSLAMLSAGQAPLLVRRADPPHWETHKASTVPLGLIDGLDIPPTATLRLQPGDLFAVVSDGILEAFDPDQRQFGVERVTRSIDESIDAPAATIIERLHHAVAAFVGGQPALDDRTAIIIKARASSEPDPASVSG